MRKKELALDATDLEFSLEIKELYGSRGGLIGEAGTIETDRSILPLSPEELKKLQDTLDSIQAVLNTAFELMETIPVYPKDYPSNPNILRNVLLRFENLEKPLKNALQGVHNLSEKGLERHQELLTRAKEVDTRIKDAQMLRKERKVVNNTIEGVKKIKKLTPELRRQLLEIWKELQED